MKMALTSETTQICNTSNNYSEDDVLVTETAEVWQTLMAVYLGAILFLSLTFNGTLCLLFYKKTHLISISNCFVLNLTVCQLCMSLFLLPFSLFAMVSQDLEYTGTWCNVQGFFFTVLIVTQQLALLIISLDRNYAIMNSLRYPNIFTQTLCIILITFSWLLALVLCAPPLLNSGLGRYVFQKNHFLCTLDWSEGNGYLITFSVLVFGLPISVQSLCYIKIFLAAVGHTKRSATVTPWVSRSSTSKTQVENESSTGSNSSLEGHRGSVECKAVRTIFIIALAFIICWVPYFIESFVTLSGNMTSPTFSAASICFLFSTGILNPLIYAYMNRVTRREIGRFVCGNSSSNDSDEFASTSMSTHTSNWSSQSKFRKRSNGGAVNNEMDTILEENEDSIMKEGELLRHSSKSELKSPGSLAHSEKIVVETDKHTTINNTEIVVESNDDVHYVDEMSNAAPTASSKDKNVTIGNTCVFGDSHWQIVNSEQFKEEKRRASRHHSDHYFSKHRRRKRRDCGSFLYFENQPDKKLLVSKRKQDKLRPGRFSLDHNITLGRFPSLMKLRLSLTDTDLQNINKVTVQSNIEIENKKANDKLAHSKQLTTEDSSSNSSCGDPDSPVFKTDVWHTDIQTLPQISRSHTENAEHETVSLSNECPKRDGQKYRRECIRSESFTMGISPSILKTPVVPFEDPHLIQNEHNETLDK